MLLDDERFLNTMKRYRLELEFNAYSLEECYSLNEIVRTHDICKETLKELIRKGKIGVIKQHTSIHNPDMFRYLIPHSEALKLKYLRIIPPIAYNNDQPYSRIEQWERTFRDHKASLRTKEDEREEAERKKWLRYIERRAELKRMSYDQYLRSPEWKELRQKRIQRDNYQCVICGSAKNLDVHHISYIHMGESGEIDDLITLCRSCHQKIHEYDIARKQAQDLKSML